MGKQRAPSQHRGRQNRHAQADPNEAEASVPGLPSWPPPQGQTTRLSWGGVVSYDSSNLRSYSVLGEKAVQVPPVTSRLFVTPPPSLAFPQGPLLDPRESTQGRGLEAFART